MQIIEKIHFNSSDMNKNKNLVLVFVLFLTLTSYCQETVAVLPFNFTDDGHISIDKGKEVQHFLIEYIHKKSKHIKVITLNGRDITIALNKAGITPETIDNFAISEINEAIGGADYILLGSVSRSFEGTTNLETNFASINDKDWNKTNVYGGSAGTTTKKYNANISISIFTDNGKTVYEKSKGNIFIDTTPDSWKNSVIWHVRHFPFYD